MTVSCAKKNYFFYFTLSFFFSWGFFAAKKYAVS